MQRSYRVLAIWPGLPGLWFQGHWLGLLEAVAFGVVLNLVLLLTFVWPGEHSPWMLGTGWLLLGAVWLAAVLHGASQVPNLVPARIADEAGLFAAAQGEYLQGHWFEAEQILLELTRQCRHDVDARLMLATLYRHTGRVAEAQRQLDELERLDGSGKWHWEIALERRAIHRQRSSAA